MCDPMEAQGRLSRTNEFMDLPEALITRILCQVAPKHMSSASRTCKYLNKLIKSPEFLKAYQLCRHKSGCIITDNFGSECPEPLLYIYDIISHQWNTIAVAKLCPSMLNPGMVSASGGLILFLADKRKNIDNGRGLVEQSKELVVVQLFTKQSIKLPDPPLVLLYEIADTCSVEIVVDDMGSSYKNSTLILQNRRKSDEAGPRAAGDGDVQYTGRWNLQNGEGRSHPGMQLGWCREKVASATYFAEALTDFFSRIHLAEPSFLQK